jgi:uncharacterized iron-regulated membrane protein
VLAHRYVGLVLALFLVVAGITGSLLAFLDPLEAAVNPHLFRVEAPASPAQPLDPITLRERVLATHPDFQLNYLPLDLTPGASQSFFVEGAPDNEIFVNPYTGELLGSRRWGNLSQGKVNLLPFIYKLHYSLALDTFGIYLFGIVALLWTLDCFVGAWLTLPLSRRESGTKRGRNWFARWAPAWLLRWTGGSHKLNFDLHRASGLWVWAMLLVLAWSSVMLNLREVYHPVMRTLLDYSVPPLPQPEFSEPPTSAPMDWRMALATGRKHMAAEAGRLGLRVHQEHWLSYDSYRGRYQYSVNSDRDLGVEQSNTEVWFDAASGQLLHTKLPTGVNSGDTVDRWLLSLHLAQVWGLPLRIFVCLMGLVVSLLSVTGIIIWWRKRAAARFERLGA